MAFGASGGSTRSSIPEQIVGSDGNIAVPFAGLVMVQGKTPRQIEADIVQRLRGKANQPQVIVRVANNASANVTVVGEVAKSLRMPLTPKGERLLDAIAAAGGVSQPTNKTTVQLSRMGKVVAMPMDQIIQDPAQNVHLQPGDVVTAVTKPLSLTVLGATGKNEEVNFEAQGISLAQAMGRAWQCQATLVFGQRPSIERGQPGAALADDIGHVGGRVGLNQTFGQGLRLDQKKPMPVSPCKGLGGLGVHGQRGRDVEQDHLAHRLWVVHAQPVGHTGPSVMRQHMKLVKAQALHQNHLVLRHAALGISGMVRAALGFGRVAITPQVGRHHAEMLGQSGGHLVPNRQGLRVPV